MLFFGIKNLWFRILLITVFAALSIFGIYSIFNNYFVIDPFNPDLQLTDRYGHNSAGDFQQYTVMTGIEFLVLMATLLPYSFSRFYWIRLLVLQMLFGSWFFLITIAGMHAGGVHGLHSLYLLAVNVAIFILLIATVIAEFAGRRKNQVNRIF